MAHRTMREQRVPEKRFLVERMLGRGGMATVYLARDRRLDRPIALKVLAGHLTADEMFHDRFLREARLAARLVHPNVVQVYDVGEGERGPYIVMEYVEGGTLADELRRRGRLPPAEAVAIGIQLCSALEAAHAEQLVHRDIKPHNILCRLDGQVKLADFGIARSLAATHHTEIGTVLGTAAYLAPEQARGDAVTAAADIYSLGVVLYELLTGRTPIKADTLSELVLKREQGAIAPLRELAPEIPAALEAVVLSCLASRPEDRPASAAVLARELAASIDEPVTEVLPAASGVRATDVLPATTVPLQATRTAAQAGGPVTRRRVLIALVAVLLLVGAGLALAFEGSGAKRTVTTTARVSTTTPATPASHPAKKPPAPPAHTTATTLTAAKAPAAPPALAAFVAGVGSAVAAGAIDPTTGQALTREADRAVGEAGAGQPAQAAGNLQQSAFAVAGAVESGRASQAEGTTLQTELANLATALGLTVTPAAVPPAHDQLPAPASAWGAATGTASGTLARRESASERELARQA